MSERESCDICGSKHELNDDGICIFCEIEIDEGRDPATRLERAVE